MQQNFKKAAVSSVLACFLLSPSIVLQYSNMFAQANIDYSSLGVKADNTDIIAHRGFHKSAVGNTIKSFKDAIKLGADFIEFDVRKTNDDTLVIFHGDSIDGKPIKKLNYVDLNKIAQKDGYTVPTLEETLQVTQSKVKLDVELKEAGYEDRVIDLILKYFKKDDFIISSFLDKAIKSVKTGHPDVKTALLFKSGDMTSRNTSWKKGLIKRVKETGADYLAPSLPNDLELYKLADSLHKRMYIWTVNSEDIILQLLNVPEVAGIITDLPDEGLKLKKAHSIPLAAKNPTDTLFDR